MTNHFNYNHQFHYMFENFIKQTWKFSESLHYLLNQRMTRDSKQRPCSRTMLASKEVFDIVKPGTPNAMTWGLEMERLPSIMKRKAAYWTQKFKVNNSLHAWQVDKIWANLISRSLDLCKVSDSSITDKKKNHLQAATGRQ